MTTTILAAVCVCAAAPSHAAEVPGYEEQVRQLRQIRGRMVMTATGALLPAGVLGPLAVRTEQQAGELLGRADGWWAAYKDVNDPEISYGGSAWRDAAVLARAWAMPGSRYRDSKDVLAAIEQGLRHLQKFAYPDCPRPNNWWAWEIGMPMHVLETLMLCGKSLDSQLHEQQVATLAYVLKVRNDLELSGAAALPLADRPGKTDMNALWRARLRFQLAIVTENPAMAGKWAQEAMSEIGAPGAGHLQADHSYKFHGAVPMWAYGRAFLSEYARLIEAAQGSAFGPSAGQIDRFAQMTMHYANGFLYRGSICPAITGREITRGENVCHDNYGLGALDALSTLIRIGHPSAREMAAIISRDRRYFLSGEVRERMEQLTAGVPLAPPAAPVDNIFAYPDSDFLQVTRPAWAVGIKMHSSRNKGYESINGENLQGWFLSHGSTFHFLSGMEWNGCWPTLDWTRLPGTTACVERRGQNESAFTGVLRASPRRALAAMELRQGEFRARKSWLVGPEHIVCVGSGIAGPGRVETTVFNQPVAAGALLLVDGEAASTEAFERGVTPGWIWLEQMGYVFAPGQRVQMKREQRTSDWTSVREPRRHGAGETRSTWYLTGFIPHDAYNSAYHYVVIPGVPAERMPELARRVLAEDVVENTGGHRIAAADGVWEALVFWEPGELGEVHAEGGCLLMRQAEAWQGADPAWSGRPVPLRIGQKQTELRSERGRAAGIQ